MYNSKRKLGNIKVQLNERLDSEVAVYRELLIDLSKEIIMAGGKRKEDISYVRKVSCMYEAYDCAIVRKEQVRAISNNIINILENYFASNKANIAYELDSKRENMLTNFIMASSLEFITRFETIALVKESEINELLLDMMMETDTLRSILVNDK